MIILHTGMDRLVKRFSCAEDGDLRITEKGIAYQVDMENIIKYDGGYFDHYVDLEGSDVCNKLNQGRVDFVKDHYSGKLLDIGIGSGAFIQAYKHADGYDVNPKALKWLRTHKKKSIGGKDNSFIHYKAYTMWDSLEHCKEPEKYLRELPKYGYLFATVPIVDMSDIRGSKHYKPNEHLYYFTEEGFMYYMSLYGYRCLELSDFEVKAGREGVLSFAFIKDLPDYHHMIAQYQKLHCEKHYGDSAYLWLKHLSPLVRGLDPKTILDYGCGRSDLVAYFWNDGERDLYRFDPAIPKYKYFPHKEIDLIFCCDVMEHILLRDVDRVLGEIRNKCAKAIFTISLKKSRANLPDGQNAHVTLLSKDEWLGWLRDYFNNVEEVKTGMDYMLTVKTW